MGTVLGFLLAVFWGQLVCLLVLISELEGLQFSRFSSGNFHVAWYSKERGNCVIFFLNLHYFPVAGASESVGKLS